MPQHPGSRHNPSGAGGGAGLAGSALQRQGVPQQGVMPGGAPSDRQAISEIIQMLRGGQVGAEKFLQLLSMLAGGTLPGMGGGGGQQARGAQGQQQTAAPGGQGGGGASIQSLLGG